MELIKDRLAHIIRAKNLTATQFAEMMQIQPSNVSHLLSGRNKPSLDFLIKLKDVFPEYSFDWIILGKKPITISERYHENKDDTPTSIDMKLKPMSENYVGDIFNIVEEEKIEPVIETKDIVDIERPKQVRQIIYMYDDNTFDIFYSRK